MPTFDSSSSPRAHAINAVVLAMVAACGGGAPAPTCTTPQRSRPMSAFAAAENKPTCLVLSVGAADALVHLGAIRAVQEFGLEIECVVGNSMGALIGGLYATAPDADPALRYQAFMQRYVQRSEAEAGRRGLVGFLFGAALTVMSGGAAAPVLLGGGALAGAATTDQRSLERTVATLDETFGGVSIEQLPVRYATSYHALEHKVALVPVTSGNLAQAIGKSVANPMIFSQFDAVEAKYLDPGADRVSGVPVQDACEWFPSSRLLVVNATGRPSFYQRESLRCPVLEIRVDTAPIDLQALKGAGAEFERALATGETAARGVLEREGIGNASRLVASGAPPGLDRAVGPARRQP